MAIKSCPTCNNFYPLSLLLHRLLSGVADGSFPIPVGPFSAYHLRCMTPSPRTEKLNDENTAARITLLFLEERGAPGVEINAANVHLALIMKQARAVAEEDRMLAFQRRAL